MIHFAAHFGTSPADNSLLHFRKCNTGHDIWAFGFVTWDINIKHPNDGQVNPYMRALVEAK